jgi:hypothetical protein
VHSWIQWQNEVVELLRKDLAEALHHITLDDVDWPSWEQLFHDGHSPRAAVNRAFEREL